MAKPKERPLVAVVGGETLLAKELREALAGEDPAPRVELISAAEDGATVLTAEEEEMAVMSPLIKESLAGAGVVFLAGTAASSRRALKINPPKGAALIDLTSALEEEPHARLRAPHAEAEPPAKPKSGGDPRRNAIQIIAHPAAIAITMLLSRLARCGRIRESLIHIFEPASERGKKGLDELHKQTVAVLAFHKVKTDVFDSQLAFNLLARYGEEAVEPLEGIEQRIERHLASLLSAYKDVPMPSLRLIQAPVFHGHSFSVWVEFEKNPGVEAITSVLSAAGIDVHPDDPPSNAGISGQSGLAVGALALDRNQPRACWMWMVADNLRLTSENAVAVAKEIW